MKKQEMFLGALVLLFVSYGQVFGLTEDFSTMALGDWLNASGTSGIAVPPYWSVDTSDDSFGHPLYPGYIRNIASNGPDSSNALEAGATDHGNGMWAWTPVMPTPTGLVTFSVDFNFRGYLPSEEWDNNRAVFYMGTNSGGRETVFLEFRANDGLSTIIYRNSNNDDTAAVVPGLLTDGSWNTLEVEMNYDTDVSSARLNGGAWASVTGVTSGSYLNQIKIMTNGILGYDNFELTPDGPPPVFMDMSQPYGLGSIGGSVRVTFADYDNDGWTDFCYGGGDIWHNNAANNFSWVTNNKGLIWADYDNDGYIDSFDGDQLFKNINGTSFSDQPFPNVGNTGTWSTCWGDFDNDGFVDIYNGGAEITLPDTAGDTSRLFYNNQGQSFSISWEQRLFKAYGCTPCDFDQDNDIDIYVSNYRLIQNHLWLNDGSGSAFPFSDQASTYGVTGGNAHSMGANWADYDNDGLIDLFCGNFSHPGQPQSRFYKNQGAPNYHFTDMGTSGVYWQESYSSPVSGDYDNDGYVDMLFGVAYGDRITLFRNDGSWNFTDVTNAVGLSGLRNSHLNGFFDFDNDDDLDLVTEYKFFVNQGNDNHWLEVKLVGNGTTVNKAAIGCQVRILNVPTLGTLTRQVCGGRGTYAHQDDQKLHFGLGSNAGPVDLEVRWLDGTVSYVTTPIDRFIQITQVGSVTNDLSGDGAIDYEDVKIITDNYLLDSGVDYDSMLAPDIAHWKLDGETTDDVGSNDGSIVGDPVYTEGMFISGLEFDGDDYVDCGNDSSLNLTNNFSIAMWVKLEGGSTLLCKGTANAAAAGGAYTIGYGGGSTCLFILRKSDDSAPVLVPMTITLDQWTHLTVTFSNGDMAVYVDGSQENTAALSTTTVNSNTDSLAIGAEADGDGAITGSIDDVRIYSYVIDQAQIDSLFPPPPGPTPTVAHWRLDSDAFDSVASNDGTLIGDPQWTDGMVEGSLQFDGDDYLDCGNDSSLNLTNNFSISMWAKPTSGSTFLCKGNVNPTAAGGAYSISSDGSSNAIFITRNSSDTAPALIFSPVTFGQWTHIVATFSDGDMTVYTDGSPAGTGTLSTTTVNTNAGPLAIAAQGDGTGALTGSIDDVRIYDYVLSQADISDMLVSPFNEQYDINKDGIINLKDFSKVVKDWKKISTEVTTIYVP